MDRDMEDCLDWILMVSLSPIAFLLYVLMALYSLLRFLCKVGLLFTLIAINTPFAVMYNVSFLVFRYDLARLRKSWSGHRNWSESRANVGIEAKLVVRSDFFKVVAGELLLLMATGIITYYTAPKEVFFISTAVWIVAIFHKWFNTKCASRTALSCLCDVYGLSPVIFLFSFIGFFDMGGHPVAKCSFVARQAFLFVTYERSKESGIEEGHSKLNEEDGQKQIPISTRIGNFEDAPLVLDMEQGDKELNAKVVGHRFDGAVINPEQLFIEFDWNAFERGLFHLSPRIDFINTSHGKYILNSFMVLKLLRIILCEYPVERLELPEDYTKTNQLYNFLVALSLADGFVTDKMRGRYEQSLTLSQIVEGVQKSDGYKTVDPMDKLFVVAECID